MSFDDCNDTRICSKCGNEFPLTREFFYQRKNEMGYTFRTECITCNKAVQKAKRDSDPEGERARKRAWTKKMPETSKEKVRARSKSARYEEARLRRYEQNRDSILEWHREYYRNNTDKAKIKRDRRRARLMNAEGEYTVDDIHLHYKNQKGKCWYCQIELKGKYHIDHRIPLSRGGSNYPNNLALTCSRCNLSKSDKLPHEWCGRLL